MAHRGGLQRRPVGEDGREGLGHARLASEEGGIGATPLQEAILAKELADRDAPTITTGTTRLAVEAVRE